MYCFVQGVAMSWTGLSDFHFHFILMLADRRFAWFSPVIILFSNYCLANKFRKTRLGISWEERKDSMINKFKQFIYCRSWGL